MIRHQLPVSSPVGIGPILRGAGAALPRGGGTLDSLAQSLRDRFSARSVWLTGSGTDALRMALEAVGDGGDGPKRPVVALPAYSCFDMVTAAVGARVRILFYDVDPNSLTPDLRSFERVLLRGATAAVVGNLHGYPVDWDEVRGIAARYGAFLVEDAAQGIGSAWRGVEAGGFGDASVLSFGRGKGWTGGGGGALLWRGGNHTTFPEPRVPALRSAGAVDGLRPLLGTTAQWIMGRPWLYGIPASIPALGLGETVYKEPRSPRAMSAAVAAVAAATETLAMSVIPARRAVALQWDDLSKRTERWVGCAPLPEGASSYLRFAAVARDPQEAARVADLLGPAGVVRGYPTSLPRLPQARDLLLDEMATPGADLLASRAITFPTHGAVTRRDFARVEGVLR